jgi:hypothetical protein
MGAPRSRHGAASFRGAVGVASVLLVALTAAGCGLFGTATPAPSSTPVAVSSAPSASVAQGPSPTPTPIPGVGPCNPIHLAARILSWDGGAGHRNAVVQLTNAGTVACTVHDLDTPQLVGGDGTILIAGNPPTSSSVLTMEPGSVLKTEVQDGNYCGPAPVPPVTVAFLFPSGEGRVVATPVSPLDVDGVPPCLGPGGPAEIEMQPWAP